MLLFCEGEFLSHLIFFVLLKCLNYPVQQFIIDRVVADFSVDTWTFDRAIIDRQLVINNKARQIDGCPQADWYFQCGLPSLNCQTPQPSMEVSLNTWMSKSPTLVKLHQNITSLCPATLANSPSNIGSKYKSTILSCPYSSVNTSENKI